MFCCQCFHISKSASTQAHRIAKAEMSGGRSVLLRPFNSCIHSGIGFGDDRRQTTPLLRRGLKVSMTSYLTSSLPNSPIDYQLCEVAIRQRYTPAAF